MARRSIEVPRAAQPRPLVPNALRAARLPDSLLLSLAAHLGVPAEAASVRAALVDGDRVARALEKASGACLAALEALAGAGGQLSEHSFFKLIERRFGWSNDHARRALDEATAAGLLIHAGASQMGFFVVMLAEVAEQIAEATLGLSLPRAPDEPVTESTLTDLRDRIARLAATAHFAVKVTRDGETANRATTRKLAAAVGMDEERLHRELREALGMDALRAEGDLIAPEPTVLRALATGRLSWEHDPESRRVRAWVPDDRWISEEALVRAMVLETRLIAEVPIWTAPHTFYGAGEAAEDAARRKVTSACTGMARIEREGHAFVRRAPVSTGDGGDGHVTPTMEVMLGPGASPELTLTIALAAEPVRFDRVLTFKLTPQAVSAAVSHGVGVEVLLAALGRVGRHAVPENVRAMVEDWARSARTARVRAVWSIELSTTEAADVAARALGKNVVARPTPRLLLVDQALATPELALAKAGVKVMATAPTEREVETETVTMPASRALALTPPPELVARFAQAKAAGFPVTRSAAATPTALATHGASKARARPAPPRRALDADLVDELREVFEGKLNDGPSRPWEVLIDRASDATSDFESTLLQLAASLLHTAGDELLYWLIELPPAEQPLAFAVCDEGPLCLAPFAALAPRWRSKLLREHRSITALVHAAERILDGAHTSDKGARLVAGLHTGPGSALWAEDRLVIRGESASETAPAAAPVASTPLKAKPTPRELQRQPREEVRRVLEESIASGGAVWALVSSKNQGDRIASLRVERMLVRGAEVVVLGTDLEAEEGRSFPLANVVAVRPQARA